MLQSRNSLEVLQAAMSSSNFGNLFPPLYMSPPPPPPPSHLAQPSQNNHLQVAGNLASQVAENPALATSASRAASATQSNESSPPRCRNNGEASQGSTRNNGESSQGSRNNGEAREGETRAASVNSQHPPGANWSFEEQFRQVRQANT